MPYCQRLHLHRNRFVTIFYVKIKLLLLCSWIFNDAVMSRQYSVKWWDYQWMWSGWWKENWQGKSKFVEKTRPTPPQNQHDLTFERSRSAAVRRRPQLVWAMARPVSIVTLRCKLKELCIKISAAFMMAMNRHGSQRNKRV